MATENMPEPTENLSTQPRGSDLPPLLIVITGVALVLRLMGAWRAGMIFDETTHWAQAETISLSPDTLHLTTRTVDHPLLSGYVTRLSSVLFGESLFGLRLLHAIVGSLSVIPIFLLTSRVTRELKIPETAAFYAATLLAIDQFHSTWSRVFMPEVLMLAFSTLATLCFADFLTTSRSKSLYLWAVCCGFGYLGKEPFVLLMPSFWIVLALSPGQRNELLKPRWYVAHAIILLIVSPDVVANLYTYESGYFRRHSFLLSSGFSIQWRSLSLYIGELFRVLIDPDVLDTDYVDGQLYACSWPIGAAMLIAVLASLKHWKYQISRLLLLQFWTIFAIFFVLPADSKFDPFWWASLSLIPAICLTACRLAELVRDMVWRRFGIAILFGLVTVFVAQRLYYEGDHHVRLSADGISKSSAEFALFVMESGKFRDAERSIILGMNVAGQTPELMDALQRLREYEKQSADRSQTDR